MKFHYELNIETFREREEGKIPDNSGEIRFSENFHLFASLPSMKFVVHSNTRDTRLRELIVIPICR